MDPEATKTILHVDDYTNIEEVEKALTNSFLQLASLAFLE
jgi:hypothetical protein